MTDSHLIDIGTAFNKDIDTRIHGGIEFNHNMLWVMSDSDITIKTKRFIQANDIDAHFFKWREIIIISS